jgi:hypothetical protein
MPFRSFIRITFFLSLLPILALTQTVFPQQLGYLEDNKVIIVFDYQLKKIAEGIQKFYPQIQLEIKEKIAWKLSYRPRIILFKDSTAFQRAVNNPYIIAYALPANELMVIDNSKMNINPFNLETTIKHELCHLILHDHIQAVNLPRWLDEGIAQWVCGGIDEVIFRERGSLLDSAVLSGRFIPLRSLQANFPRDKNSLLLAYEQSKNIVEYIIKKYGEQGLQNLLERLKNGHPIEEAINDEFAISFPDLEAEWRNHLHKQAIWLTYLIDHLYELLFILGGILLCFGFIRVWLKKRSLKDEYWDDLGD